MISLRGVRFINRRQLVARGWRGRRNGELVFNGYRVSVWKKFWRWLCNNVTILNATELYT